MRGSRLSWCARAAALGVAAAAVARAVRRRVRALVDLEPLRGGRAAAPVLDESDAGEALAALERERPPLLPGSRLPAFEARDESGASVGAKSLAGHAVLVVA